MKMLYLCNAFEMQAVFDITDTLWKANSATSSANLANLARLTDSTGLTRNTLKDVDAGEQHLSGYDGDMGYEAGYFTSSIILAPSSTACMFRGMRS